MINRNRFPIAPTALSIWLLRLLGYQKPRVSTMDTIASSPTTDSAPITASATTAAPATARPRGVRTFTAAIIPGNRIITPQQGNRATTGRAGAATEVGSGDISRYVRDGAPAAFSQLIIHGMSN